MPTNTPNLSIPKPLGTEFFNRTNLNAILDAIDVGAPNWVKSYGIGDVGKDVSGTNLNNIDVSGVYQGGTLTNAPSPYNQGYIIHMKMSSISRKQLFFVIDSNVTFQRFMLSGVWTPWYEILTTDTNYIDFTLQNGATEFSVDRRPGYMKSGKTITIRGAVKNISTSSVIVATLPTGYRPVAEFSYTATTSTVSNKSRSARISVATNGEIQIQYNIDNVYNVGDIYYLQTSFTL
ncbi:hypothetical protein CN692_13325 [Bacillus sp. AFS002410]|uniref:pyocin knob domain-containing protein n=1 Tax=Bacillus sp. AFS002410 TaxID=2033481 RepID=UPI000BEFFF71|nr:pyocin knob domain-containing protein [Bacillus sp. AFS002410]PEJ57389.1 hypothetical protein CN692_13325 [Bacillus sp. AFS002410]